MVGDAGKVHAPACTLDDQQRLHAPQEARVDGEQVARQQGVRLGGQKLFPGGSRSPRRRVDAGPAQDLPDRAGGDRVAKAGQLPLDAAVPPTRILPR
jgi:hypothetical protein